jgi:hypothetical protein
MMVVNGMMLGEVANLPGLSCHVSNRHGTGLLSDAVLDPVETHVHGFGAFLLDGVIGNSTGSAVVGDKKWLGMAELAAGDTDRGAFFAVVKEAALCVVDE